LYVPSVSQSLVENNDCLTLTRGHSSDCHDAKIHREDVGKLFFNEKII
jgi:hypothetical protein